MDLARLQARTEASREEIARVARDFAAAAGRALAGALERGMDRLVQDRAAWFNALDEGTAAAFRGAVREAIRRSAETVTQRLQDLDQWLSPAVRLDLRPPRPMEQLDHPSNRVWIALLNGADRLDPVLVEFGLEPSEVPDPGGGHFGLQPRTLRDLDPTGRLGRLWQRYVVAYGRYAALLAQKEAEERRRDTEREQEAARRRWRGSG